MQLVVVTEEKVEDGVRWKRIIAVATCKGKSQEKV